MHALIVGGDDVSYGKRPKDAKNWREKMLREVKLDATRTHFLGRVPRQQNIKVLQVSAAHVYLNNPFVLSWSLLEAMHCGALVLGSDTAPVQEVIRGEENGVLSTFFDLVRTSDCIDWALQRGAQTLVMRHRAQQLAAQHSPANSLSGYQAIVASMRPGAVDLTRLQPLSKSTHLPQELKELSWLS